MYKLKDLYTKKTKTLAQDGDICRSSLEDHMKESTFKIKMWVILNGPLILQSMKERKEKKKKVTISGNFLEKHEKKVY